MRLLSFTQNVTATTRPKNQPGGASGGPEGEANQDGEAAPEGGAEGESPEKEGEGGEESPEKQVDGESPEKEGAAGEGEASPSKDAAPADN